MKDDMKFSLTCPLPISDYPKVLMAHGSGGLLMQQLIEKVFYAAFGNSHLLTAHDATVLDIPQKRIAMSTDSYVVQPLFFPGGNIGCLAINGTVNDLAMSGARPLYLSASFILEEGLSMETLWRVVQSMREAAAQAGVSIVTGDTKVVEKGHGDGLFINTTGIGVLEHDDIISPDQVRDGDAVLLSGDIGRHGMAVMTQRESLSFESAIESDSMPLWKTVNAMLEEGIRIHCLRDATRGGLAAVLNEIAAASKLQIDVDENVIPVDSAVRGACEILGIDPLHVANEGRFSAFVAAEDSTRAVEIMNRYSPQKNAACIGSVVVGKVGLVTLKTPIGGHSILDMPSGELLPRIC
ncbi:MAG: hydrogenase expression/formation protein HypE [Alphaproteobacteria bacterium]|nr:hydrogenase expression/formation protein HypE [Alphaproteobacteria bacterium]